MPRALGANAAMALSFEQTYGVRSTENYYLMPFSPGTQLGSKEDLVADDTLGLGRNVGDPDQAGINVTGSILVPVDGRNFGVWLKMTFGDPTTTEVAARQRIRFAGQPVAGSKLHVNGTDWTFVAAGAAGQQSNIGISLAATLTAAAAALNASADTQVAKCTYTAGATWLDVVFDTVGLTGNDFAISADANTNAKVRQPTLVGGGYKHTFTSGAAALPSASVEVGHPDISAFFMNLGIQGPSLSLELTPTGLMNATISLIGREELAPSNTTLAGTPDTLVVKRFPRPSGAVLRDGVELANITSAQFSYDNKVEAARSINADRLIDGVDLGVPATGLQTVMRFTDIEALTLATNLTPVENQLTFVNADKATMVITLHRVFVPRPERPITGPNGIQLTYAGQAVTDPTLNKIVTIELTNDVADYDNPA